MAMGNKPTRWFCRSDSSTKIDGPFDLVELAALLRAGDISGDTLTQEEGEQPWLAFQSRPQFDLAKTMPADVIYRHLKDEKENLRSWWSLSHLYYLGSLVFGTLGYALFHGINPIWAAHWFQRFVIDFLIRVSVHGT
jgi:hypothetical protein